MGEIVDLAEWRANKDAPDVVYVDAADAMTREQIFAKAARQMKSCDDHWCTHEIDPRVYDYD